MRQVNSVKDRDIDGLAPAIHQFRETDGDFTLWPILHNTFFLFFPLDNQPDAVDNVKTFECCVSRRGDCRVLFPFTHFIWRWNVVTVDFHSCSPVPLYLSLNLRLQSIAEEGVGGWKKKQENGGCYIVTGGGTVRWYLSGRSFSLDTTTRKRHWKTSVCIEIFF